MPAEFKKLLFVSGTVGIISILSSFRKVFNKELNRDHSEYYMQQNIFLTGIISILLFIYTLIYLWSVNRGQPILSQDVFGWIGFVWISIMGTLVGLQGYFHKKDINNQSFNYFNTNSLILSMICLTFLIIITIFK